MEVKNNRFIRASRQNKILEMHALLFVTFDPWSEYINKKIVLVSPTVNSGEKERLHLQNFVLIGRPKVYIIHPAVVYRVCFSHVPGEAFKGQ